MHLRADVLGFLQGHDAVVAQLAVVLSERLGDALHATEGLGSIRPNLVPRSMRPRVTRLVPIDRAPSIMVPLDWILVQIRDVVIIGIRLEIRAVIRVLVRGLRRKIIARAAFQVVRHVNAFLRRGADLYVSTSLAPVAGRLRLLLIRIWPSRHITIKLQVVRIVQ